MDEQQEFNFGDEVAKLRKPQDYEKGEWFKPTPGQHKIVCITDPVKYHINWEDKVINKIRIEIELDKKKLVWGVTLGSSENSLYGQLLLVGKKAGTLIGEVITLVVKGTGKETSYVILEALPLMESAKPKQEEAKDEVVA